MVGVIGELCAVFCGWDDDDDDDDDDDRKTRHRERVRVPFPRVAADDLV